MCRIRVVPVILILAVAASLPDALWSQTEPRVQRPSFSNIPADRSLTIPKAQSALAPGSDVLQRIGAAHDSARLAQLDLTAEGTVTLQTEGGDVLVGVTVIRNGLRGQQILLRQGRGQTKPVAAGQMDATTRRVMDFLQTQQDRGIGNLLQATARNAVILDGGTKDDERLIVVRESDGLTTRYVFDNATARLARVEFQRGRSQDSSGRLLPNLESFVFSDFRMIQGVATAFKVEHYINGIEQEELRLPSVRYVPAPRDTSPRHLRGGPRQ